jgi:hypothetical protein
MADYYVATTGNDTTGVGSSGNPYATLGKAVSVMAGSDRVFVATGVTDTRTTAIVPPAGTAGTATQIIGTDASWNPLDGPDQAANFPVVIMNNVTLNCFDLTNNYIVVRNYKADGGVGASKAARCFNMQGTNIRVINCWATRFSDFGFLSQSTGLIQRAWASAGVSGARHGIRSDNAIVIESAATGNACAGVFHSAASVFARCFSINNTGGSSIGCEIASSGVLLDFVAYGNGSHGVSVTWAGGMVAVRNAILYGNTGKGINSSTTLTWADADYNAFGSNTGGDRSGVSAGSHDVSLSGNPFVNSGATLNSLADVFANFALNSTAGAGAACRSAGATSYSDIGAVQHQDAGGGGTTVIIVDDD